MSLVKDLIRHEGHRRHLYEDTAGVMSIGVGYNIQERGLPDHVIAVLLEETIKEAESELLRVYPKSAQLTKNRQEVLINMMFNLGAPRFLMFRRMLEALTQGDYALAAEEMLDSRWAEQVGQRAIELAGRMRNDT